MALYIVVDEVDCETAYRKYFSDIKKAMKAFETIVEESTFDDVYLKKWESEGGEFQRKALVREWRNL